MCGARRPRRLCASLHLPIGEGSDPDVTLPATVAVTARVGMPCMARQPLRSVEPLVTTSSIKTTDGEGRTTPRKPTAPRSALRDPACLGHHSGARSAESDGSPVSRPSARTSSHEGSTPYRSRRVRERGTGTSAAAQTGMRGTMSSASGSAAASTPRYLRRWTSRRAAPSCRAPPRINSPPEERAGAGRIELWQPRHSCPDAGAAHARHTMGQR